MSSTSHEEEIKIPVSNLETLRRRLVEVGGALEQAMQRERNVLLDTDRAALTDNGRALRLRTWAGRAMLTFKGPVTYDGPVKIREELETAVGDVDCLEAILGRLGLRPWIRYEKDRESWRLGPALVTLDHTPMGDFVEVEGPREEIGALAEKLGLDVGSAVRESYVSLWQSYRRVHGLGRDMVFEHH